MISHGILGFPWENHGWSWMHIVNFTMPFAAATPPPNGVELAMAATNFLGRLLPRLATPNWRFFQLPCEKSAVKEHRHSCDPERPFWSGRAVDIPPWSSVFDMQLWQSKEESGPQSARPQWLRSSLQLIVVFLDWYHLAAVQPQIEDPAGQNQGPGCCEKKINKRIHLWWSSEDATN